MDFKERIEKFDKSNALEFLKTFPQQCREALELGKALDIKKDREIKNVVSVGMGGSGIGGRIIKNLMKNELKVPFDCYNTYTLPAYIDENSLVIIVSYSGNTEEPLNCISQAKEKNCLLVSLCTGGKLKGQIENEIIFPAKAPEPRMAVPFLSLPVLPVLEKLGLLGDMKENYSEMLSLLENSVEEIDEIAQKLAIDLHDTYPIVYASDEMDSVAYRWVCELNETPKMFGHWQAIPEMNHNEINADTGPNNMTFIFLRSKNENERVSKRFEITKDFFKDFGKQIEIWAKGDSLLARMYYHIFIDELTTVYLALLNDKDPSPVPIIDILKEKLED